MREFTIRQEHLDLLKHAIFRYEDRVEFGAPAMDPKRPYGNSSVLSDMREILDGEYEDAELHQLHEELTYVLKILVENLDAADLVGSTFVSDYGYEWKKLA